MRDLVGIGLALLCPLFVLEACSPATHRGGTGDVDGGNNGSGSGSNPGFPDCDPQYATACNGADIVACNPDGTFGATQSTCGDGMTCAQNGADTSCTRACSADGVDLVYVVDIDNNFLSFDPRILAAHPTGTPSPFTLIGSLSCPTQLTSIQTGSEGQTPTPFSMSIDRDGKAWVLYTSGEIMNVSLTDASCTASPYTAKAGGMLLFGMGYVTDTAGGDTEQLFLAGGGNDAQAGGKLASVDTHGAMYTPVQHGNVPSNSDYSPELTGTGEAKLYGFFPNLSTPSFVSELDRATGAAVGSPLPLGNSGLGTQVNAWAFAQWGGKFYVFVTSDGNSTVRVVDRGTGMYTLALQNLPNEIVGAGVSTCAPSVIGKSH